MSKISIRQLHGDDILDVLPELDSYAFSPTPPMPEKSVWKEALKPRYGSLFLALYADSEPMAIAASRPMTQNVRGKLYPMGGVCSVSASPEGRRKGHTKRLLTELLATIRDDGQPVSTLYPFRESFYERLGYAGFPHPRLVHFATADLAPVFDLNLAGAIKRLPVEEGRSLCRTYLRKYQRATHGFALDEISVSQMKNLWVAFAQINGEVTGLMTYKLQGDQGNFTMGIRHFYYDNSPAKYLLLDWIARHIDQARTVEMRLSPAEVPESWLADIDLRISSDVQLGEGAPMGRVIDALGIGGMQTGPGRFSARITEPLCPWNEGVYLFETIDGVLQVSKTGEADCDLTIQALSALVYGTHDPDDFAFRGWGNPSPEVQTILKGMFARMMPHLHERF